MRTLALKLLSLLVLLAGLLLAAAVMDPTGTVMGMLYRLPDLAAAPVEGGVIDWRLVGAVAGVSFALLGLTGLLPARRRGAGTISFRGDRSEVVIELGPIQKTLAKVIYSLPDVRRARVRVKPEKDGRRVQVRAEVTLQNCSEHGLRKTANLVSACISEAVGKSMGLEDLATVQLVIRGVHVDARATARRLHDEMESRAERESTTLEVAVAHPPISSVTMEDLKTTDPEPAAPVVLEAVQAVAPEPEPETQPMLAAVSIEEPTAAPPEPEAPVAVAEPTADPEPAAAVAMAEPAAAPWEPEAPVAVAEPTVAPWEPDAAAEPVVEDIPLAVAAPEEAQEASSEASPEDTAYRPQG
jgi:hypothetical protein